MQELLYRSSIYLITVGKSLLTIEGTKVIGVGSTLRDSNYAVLLWKIGLDTFGFDVNKIGTGFLGNIR